MRPQPLHRLLVSVMQQTRKPDEILIVDGSTNDGTQQMLAGAGFEGVRYYQVSAQDRGLTRQRNFGIQKVAGTSAVICFLDDDTVLEPDYFEQLLSTYIQFPEALAVGGYISNEVVWETVPEGYVPRTNEYVYDELQTQRRQPFCIAKEIGSRQ